MEDWGEEIFPEGGGVKFKKWTRDITRYPLCTNPPLAVKHPRWRQRKPDILTFRYKITPALQARNPCDPFGSHIVSGSTFNRL